jgi:energy-converting hydrogenase Eha subunit B
MWVVIVSAGFAISMAVFMWQAYATRFGSSPKKALRFSVFILGAAILTFLGVALCVAAVDPSYPGESGALVIKAVTLILGLASAAGGLKLISKLREG